jgi:hypothetical protein
MGCLSGLRAIALESLGARVWAGSGRYKDLLGWSCDPAEGDRVQELRPYSLGEPVIPGNPAAARYLLGFCSHCHWFPPRV